jgi:hypothetical protein
MTICPLYGMMAQLCSRLVILEIPFFIANKLIIWKKWQVLLTTSPKIALMIFYAWETESTTVFEISDFRTYIHVVDNWIIKRKTSVW